MPVYCFANVLCYTDTMWGAIGAWVQAVGSVAAIFFAYWIAHLQFKEADRQARAARAALDYQRIEIVRTLLAQIRSLCTVLATGLGNVPPYERDAMIRELDTRGHFELVCEAVRNVAAA